MKKFIKTGIISLALLPFLAFAAGGAGGGSGGYLTGTNGIAVAFGNIINLLIPIAFSLALLYFFYGVAKYIRTAGAEKEEGRMIMVWGVVALFVMSSIWGLVTFIQKEFSVVPTGGAMTIPTIE